MATGPVSHQMDVYGAWLHLATTRGQWKQLKQTTGLKLSKINSLGLVEKHIHGKTNQVALCVYIGTKHQTATDLLDTCVHEATHAAGMLLDHIGQSYDGTSEAHAHLVAWITVWLWSRSQ